MQALRLPQPQLERLLEEIAAERGADIRRGHEVVGVSQDRDATVTADVRGPDGPYRVTARYLVGCDGVRSRVRAMAGIPFRGMTYPEVNRLGQFTMPDSVTLRADGDYEVPGIGRLRAGFTRTERGEFAIASYTPNDLGVYTSEEDAGEYDDETPMTVTEFQDSVRRVLGADVPLGEPTRLSRFTFHARHVERYRDGRILVAGDAAHQFPAPGVAVNAGMMDAVNLAWKLAADIAGWAPADLLDTYHDERHLAGARTLLHTQAQVALRRGHDPAAEALRELFSELVVDEQPLHRMGALIAGTDIRYPMPGPDQHAIGRYLRRRPPAAHRPRHHQCRGTHARRAARLTRPRRPPGPARGRARLAASGRHPHRHNRSAPRRRPADPAGRPHRVGRNRRRAHRRRRGGAARCAGCLVRSTPGNDGADAHPSPPEPRVTQGLRHGARLLSGIAAAGIRTTTRASTLPSGLTVAAAAGGLRAIGLPAPV